MKNYLFVGDTHGDLDFLQRAAEEAALHEAEIIQVGDWGFVWPRGQTLLNYVPELQRILTRAGEMHAQPPVTMRFIDGNHDHHVWLRERAEAFSDAGETLEGGGHLLDPKCPNVIYQPRGSTYTDEDGTTFLFCGGAPSIDSQFRVDRKSWWREEEVISDEEFQRCLDFEDTVHVLVTHDAPAFPIGYGPKGDYWFQERGERSMATVAAIAIQHRPELLVHGHWHTRHSTTLFGHAPTDVTRVEGLDCNYAGRFEDAVLLWSRAHDKYEGRPAHEQSRWDPET